MGPSGGPVLGPFETRGEASAEERGWLLGCTLFTDAAAGCVPKSAVRGPSEWPEFADM